MIGTRHPAHHGLRLGREVHIRTGPGAAHQLPGPIGHALVDVHPLQAGAGFVQELVAFEEAAAGLPDGGIAPALVAKVGRDPQLRRPVGKSAVDHVGVKDQHVAGPIVGPQPGLGRVVGGRFAGDRDGSHPSHLPSLVGVLRNPQVLSPAVPVLMDSLSMGSLAEGQPAGGEVDVHQGHPAGHERHPKMVAVLVGRSDVVEVLPSSLSGREVLEDDPHAVGVLHPTEDLAVEQGSQEAEELRVMDHLGQRRQVTDHAADGTAGSQLGGFRHPARPLQLLLRIVDGETSPDEQLPNIRPHPPDPFRIDQAPNEQVPLRLQLSGQDGVVSCRGCNRLEWG